MHHLLTLLIDGERDVAAVTETWFKAQLNNCTATLRENGYSIFHFHRENKGGGGVALIYKQELKLHSAKTYHFETFECILVSLSGTDSKKINFVVVYRFCQLSPSLFLPEFYDFIETLFISLRNIIFLGDFNLHVNKAYESDVIRFNEILGTFGLNQLIQEPTHISGNTLDLIITNPDEIQIDDILVDHTSYSDHSVVFFRVPFKSQKSEDKIVTLNDYQGIDMSVFKNEIASKVNCYIENQHTSFGEALNEYNNLCLSAVKPYVKVKTINISKVRPKWIDSAPKYGRNPYLLVDFSCLLE